MNAGGRSRETRPATRVVGTLLVVVFSGVGGAGASGPAGPRACLPACSACPSERGEVAGSAPARRAARPLLAGPLDRRGGVDGSSPGAARGSRLADGEFA